MDGEISAWDLLARSGCDMSLLEDNLRKTPAERIKTHQRAVNTATILREAMDRSRDKETVLQLNAIKEKNK